MPDFEVDDDSLARAERLASRLVHDLRSAVEEGGPSELRQELFSAKRYPQEAEGVPLSDVFDTFRQIAAEFGMARRWDGEVVCLELADGDLVPMSLRGVQGSNYPFLAYEDLLEAWERYGPFPPHFLHRFWRDAVQRARKWSVRMTGIQEAQEAVGAGVRRFLGYRFGGMKRWAEWIRGDGGDLPGNTRHSGGSGSLPPPPAVGANGGLQVQVSCRTPGLRIHVSPAYFVTWVYFGSPTTPVAGWLQPGRYIFAGDGPMLPNLTLDNGIFSIPPSYHPSLMRF